MIIYARTVGALIEELKDISPNTKIATPEIEVLLPKTLSEIPFWSLTIFNEGKEYSLKCIDQSRNAFYYYGEQLWGTNRLEAMGFPSREAAALRLKGLLT